MAKNIDEYQLNITATGTAQITEAAAATNNFGEQHEKASGKIKQSQQNIRNIGFQIQDFTVQVSNGTSVVTALSQQLPQLLGGFGTIGIYLGIAAAAIPLFTYGLKLAGVDMRSLDERTKDLIDSVDKLKASQSASLPTVDGLRAAYGELAVEAKKYLDSVEKLAQIKAATELEATLSKILQNFTQAGTDLQTILDTSQGITFEEAAMSASVLGASVSLLALKTGLSANNAEILSDKLKQLDKNSKPEEVVRVVREINDWLVSSGLEGSKVLRVMEEVTKPLNDAAQAALKMKENVAKTSQAASELAAILTGLQNKYLPSINDAKRNFDQITAIRQEGVMKQAEFEARVKERRDKGEIVTAKEISATKLRISQETGDKEKDFLKTQQETFYGQMLNNEAKQSQLDLQGKINTLQMGQVESLNYASILEESSLRNIHDQQQALLAIEELRRKNAITEERAGILRQQAGEIRKTQDANAEQAAIKIGLENQRSIRLQLEGMTLANNERSRSLDLEGKIFGLSSNTQAAKRKELELETSQLRTIREITNNNRLSEEEKQQAIAGVNEQYKEGLRLIEQELAYRNELDKNFKAGAQDRAKQIAESFTPFKMGGMVVDSVFNNMSSALDKFVETGKFSFGDFARSVIYDLEKIALKSAVIGVFQSMGLGSIFSLPGRASGGPVSGGTPYLIGEQGPELFIPNSAGTVVPNSQLGSSGGRTTIINNISAIDAKGVAQLFAENRMTLFGNVEQARRELPMRTR